MPAPACYYYNININIGLLSPVIHGIRVASVITFSVCVCSLSACLSANFLILLLILLFYSTVSSVFYF